MSQSDFVTRGQALVNAGQFQEAVKVCRLGLLGRPTTVEGRVVLGQALLALKRFDEVLAEMRVALELDPSSIPAQVLKGEALLRKGDPQGAVDVLHKVRALAPTDPRIAQLGGEAERAGGRPRPGASQPFAGGAGPGRAGFDDAFAVESQTKHYPHHADQEDTGRDGQEDTGGSFTQQTSLAVPGAKRGSHEAAPAPAPQPAPQPQRPLRSGFDDPEPSGTVEVDPEEEGVEIGADEADAMMRRQPADAPVGRSPRGRGGKRAEAAAAKPKQQGAERSARAPQAQAKAAPQAQQAARKAARGKGEVSSVELDDDELMEVEETAHASEPAARAPVSSSAVRNAINRPSGPMPDPSPSARSPMAMRSAAPSAPPQLAQLIANQPHVMAVSPVQPSAPLPPAPAAAPYNARSAIAAALPTQAAMPVPAASLAAAARQTVVAQPAPQPFPAPGVPQQAQWAPPDARTAAPWAQPGPMGQMGQMNQMGQMGHMGHMGQIGPDEATRQPMPIDPRLDAHLVALSAEGSPPSAVSGPVPVLSEASQTGGKALRTGMRKTRSRLQIVLWVLIGAAMIGGGVFAGFQIRAMRLGKQIEALRGEAMRLATADTWLGWQGARTRLASIAQASATPENRAALARARAVLAYEFGDGAAEAQAAVADLQGQGGIDGELAAAFIALARSDAKAARAAAERALALDANDAAALYASSQAALLAGELKLALEAGKQAVERDARAMYAAGLARVHAAATSWEEGLAATDQALKATPDHPGALIVRGVLLAEGGRITATSPAGTEIRGQLDKVVREGTRPITEQPRGVSPAQVAYSHLALVRVDAARGNVDAAKADLANALAVGLDEQRFAEELAETLYAINLLDQCRRAIERALATWPGSLRARAIRAQLAIAQGRPDEALAVLEQGKDKDKDKDKDQKGLLQLVRGLAVRGAARLAAGDIDGARADYEDALKRLPRFEPAVIGRAQVELRAGLIEDAQKRLEALYRPAGASPALGAAYAQVLYAAGDPALRDKAKAALEKAAGAGALIDAGRAQLEYARVLRDHGDANGARAMYEQAIRGGLAEARLEAAMLHFEQRQPADGRKAIEALVQEAGEGASPALLLEAARARMLVGDHPAAASALERLGKLQGVVAWQLDRERGHLALRRGDLSGAAQFLVRALDGCGDDAETFLLAAEVANADIRQARLVEKLQNLTKSRLKDRPEALIVAGKLALAEEKFDEAGVAYEKASAALAKASARRQAQAEFGRAVVAYNQKQDDMSAMSRFKLAIAQDPTLYNAYLYYADLVRDQALDEALEYVKKAVEYNPDSVDGWAMYGAIAHRLRKPKELATAVRRVGSLAPGSEALRQLQSLR